jgi:hypothetical protein
MPTRNDAGRERGKKNEPQRHRDNEKRGERRKKEE